MNLTSNATTGYFRWAPPPRNDGIESSLVYLTLVFMNVLLFATCSLGVQISSGNLPIAWAAGGLAVQGSNVPLAVDSVQHVFLNHL